MIALREMGIEEEVETLRRTIGKGGNELLPQFVPWWRRKHVDEPLKAYRKFVFEQEFLPRVKALPGAHDFLVRLKEAGIQLVLATSSNEQDLEAMKKIVGMDGLVSEQTTADDTEKAKPHPDIFEAALKRAGCKPAEALALGDTPYDAEAAGKAGIWTIGVETGGWSRGDLLGAGCLEVYKSVDELRERFAESALSRL